MIDSCSWRAEDTLHEVYSSTMWVLMMELRLRRLAAECTAQLAPVAQSLGSSPKASGGSPQISLLPDPDQPGWQHPGRLQVLKEAGGASGRPAGRSRCAPVNPAGTSGSLRVSASGSEQHGCLQAVQEVSCAPETNWEGAACTGESSTDKTN